MPEARLFQIIGRTKPDEFGPALLSDFATDAGVAVPGTIIATDRRWSLYGLDFANGHAIFVLLPPQTDLSAAAFLPHLQYAAAQQVLTLALADLLVVAARLPAPEQPILIFSIGRCGSTLASRILSKVPGVWSLSEPEPFLTLALQRHILLEDQQQALIVAVTRLIFRPPPGRSATRLAIKFHSQALFQAELFYRIFLYRIFPGASYIFLYRDGKSWANSVSGFMQNLGLPLPLDHSSYPFAWMMISAATPLAVLEAATDLSVPLLHEDLLAPAWALHIAEYRRLFSIGLPFLAVDYKDLNGNPSASTAQLLARCALPATALTTALTAFDRDSQDGTAIARGGNVTRFGPANYARFTATLARISDLPDDVVLPSSPQA